MASGWLNNWENGCERPAKENPIESIITFLLARASSPFHYEVEVRKWILYNIIKNDANILVHLHLVPLRTPLFGLTFTMKNIISSGYTMVLRWKVSASDECRGIGPKELRSFSLAAARRRAVRSLSFRTKETVKPGPGVVFFDIKTNWKQAEKKFLFLRGKSYTHQYCFGFSEAPWPSSKVTRKTIQSHSNRVAILVRKDPWRQLCLTPWASSYVNPSGHG